jgi:hypothetical protein
MTQLAVGVIADIVVNLLLIGWNTVLVAIALSVYDLLHRSVLAAGCNVILR